jgi:hypothetical protein
VIVEMDDKMVVDDVQRPKPNWLKYGFIINKCRSLLSVCKDYIVCLCYVTKNGTAHALAQVSLFHTSRSILMLLLHILFLLLLLMKFLKFATIKEKP